MVIRSDDADTRGEEVGVALLRRGVVAEIADRPDVVEPAGQGVRVLRPEDTGARLHHPSAHRFGLVEECAHGEGTPDFVPGGEGVRVVGAQHLRPRGQRPLVAAVGLDVPSLLEEGEPEVVPGRQRVRMLLAQQLGPCPQDLGEFRLRLDGARHARPRGATLVAQGEDARMVRPQTAGLPQRERREVRGGGVIAARPECPARAANEFGQLDQSPLFEGLGRHGQQGRAGEASAPARRASRKARCSVADVRPVAVATRRRQGGTKDEMRITSC
nr:hypothetical protein [Nonomuraea deserti]